MKRSFLILLPHVFLTLYATTSYTYWGYHDAEYLSEYSIPLPSRNPYFEFTDFNKKNCAPVHRFLDMQPCKANFQQQCPRYPQADFQRPHIQAHAHASKRTQQARSPAVEHFLQHATPEQVLYLLGETHGDQLGQRQSDILSLYEYYQYNSFVEAIKIFPAYPAHILAFAKRIRTSWLTPFLISGWLKKKFFTLEKEVLAQQKIEEQKLRAAQEREQQRNARIAKINATLNSERSDLKSLCQEYETMYKSDFVTDQQRARYKNRTNVIEQFLQQSSQLYDASHEITTDTRALLTHHGMNKNSTDEFAQCLGNKLQHAAQQECVEALNQFTRKYKTVSMPCVQNLMIDSAMLGSRLAKSGHVVTSFTCADLCWALVDCGQAAFEGAGDGILNIANIVMHPIDTVKNAALGTAMIIGQIGKTLYHLGAIGTNYCIDPERGKQLWNEYCDQSDKLCKEIGNQLKNMTTHGAIRTASAFATETFLMTKLLSSANKVCHAAKGNLVEVVKSIESTEAVVATAQGTPIKVATKAKKIVKTKKIKTVSKSRNVLLMENAKLNAVAREVISDSKKFLQVMHADFTQTIKNEVVHLRTLFDNTVKGFAEFSNKYIKFDYEHIFGMKLSFSKKGVPQLGGFHHDFMGKIEKSGVFKFVDKIIYENGYYKAILKYKGDIAKSSATFFPAHWSQEKVMETILEAYNKFIQSGKQIKLEKGGKYLIDVAIEENVRIHIHITQNGLITSAYPVLM